MIHAGLAFHTVPMDCQVRPPSVERRIEGAAAAVRVAGGEDVPRLARAPGPQRGVVGGEAAAHGGRLRRGALLSGGDVLSGVVGLRVRVDGQEGRGADERGDGYRQRRGEPPAAAGGLGGHGLASSAPPRRGAVGSTGRERCRGLSVIAGVAPENDGIEVCMPIDV
nr:hypothetical protein GCM10025732_51460 [Glycomyces mayteni]